jgi:hypothetical protein
MRKRRVFPHLSRSFARMTATRDVFDTNGVYARPAAGRAALRTDSPR